MSRQSPCLSYCRAYYLDRGVSDPSACSYSRRLAKAVGLASRPVLLGRNFTQIWQLSQAYASQIVVDARHVIDSDFISRTCFI